MAVNGDCVAGRHGWKLGVQLAEEFYGLEGPDMESSIDEIEDLAVRSAQAVFEGMLGGALDLQNKQLPKDLPCPDCGETCEVKFETRTIQTRLCKAEISEPFCHCSTCCRDFFPSSRNTPSG